MKSSESQKDWFGKRGMPLLGAMLLWIDPNGKLESHYVDMVLDNDGEQAVDTSMSLLDGLLHYIKLQRRDIQKVYLVSDNGSHFSSHDLVYFLRRLNLVFGDDLAIAEYMFSEATWGLFLSRSCPVAATTSLTTLLSRKISIGFSFRLHKNAVEDVAGFWR